MSEKKELLLCYHRGCGQKFDPNENNKDSCRHHPGVPVFHDAYKGWSCCKKKCTDFTEFLNIKGCTSDFHSNEKPPEPVKPPVDKEKSSEVIIVKAPEISRLPRPPFDTPLIALKPSIADTLLKQVSQLVISRSSNNESDTILPGTACKNGGCKSEYKGQESNLDVCVYHPGVPIFHEGLKFWSCCTKRTTDFSAFLAQVGCENGKHRWTEDKNSKLTLACRHDWHQTGSHVIVSIYAKKYDPEQSTIELNPIRIKVRLYFPENGNEFLMDEELRGVIDVDKSEVSMLSTKVEIRLRKAELGSWAHLTFPQATKAVSIADTPTEVKLSNDDEAVDLSDIY